MYAGHVAVGVALAAAAPRVHPAVPLVGVGFLDLLDGVLVAAGVQRISPAPEVPLGISLDFIDWDHSLLMAVVWAAVFGVVVAWRWGRDAGIVGALAVFSHFLADWPVHDPDLALYPHSDAHLGMGMWRAMPVGSWLFEGALVAALLGVAWRHRERRGITTPRFARVALVLAVLQLSFWPAIAPLHLAGTHLDGAALAWAYAAAVVVGFTVPGLLLAPLLRARA